MTGLITFAGIGSGLDVEAIIEAVTNAERAPKEASLARQEFRAQSQLSGIGQLKSALSDFQDALAKLDAINDSRKVTSSDEDQLTATVTSASAIGSFDVNILQTATNTQYTTNLIAGADSSTVLGDGNMTFANGNGDNFSIAVGATDSLNDIVNAINSDSNNFGITASLIVADSGAKIVYRSTQTGDDFDFTVTNDNANLAAISDGNGGVLNKDQTAQNAQIEVAGLNISSTTNTFDGAVNGVTLILDKDATPGTVTIDVEKDTQNVRDNIDNFITSYNALINTTNRLGSNELGASGPLAGDASLRNIMNQIRSVISSTVASAPAEQNTLSLVGITTQSDGTLSKSTLKLENALSNNFDAVASLFSSTDGIVASLNTAIDPYTEFSGILETRETTLNNDISSISKQREDLDYRIIKLEATLRAKYAAMDSTISRFNFTASFLEQQFSSKDK